ncbi:MAG TPA: hypothetical protein VF070_49500 [Streptosporangiaceae bacterium]
MKLSFLGTTSYTGGCPTLYRTSRGTVVVQGNRLTDPEALSLVRNVLDGETFVEVPAELGKYWPPSERLGQLG